MMMTHPLDGHAQAIGAPHPRNPAYYAYIENAAAVLRVELTQELSQGEIESALTAWLVDSDNLSIFRRMENALKTARAARLKALGLDK